MKNLPDDDVFKIIEGTLRKYEETPDDDTWHIIAEKIAPKKHRSTKRIAAVLGVFSLLVIGSAIIYHAEFVGRNTNELRTETKQSPIMIPNAVTGEKELSNDSPKVELGADSIALKPSGGIVSSTGNANGSSPLVKRNTRHGSEAEPLGVTTKMPPDDGNSINDPASFKEMNVTLEPTVLQSAIESPDFQQGSQAADSLIAPTDVVDTRKKITKKSQLTFYGLITPTLGYYHITPKANDDVSISGVKGPGVMSSERVGFNFEAGMRSNIGRRINLTTGLSYYTQNTSIAYEEQFNATVTKEGPFDYYVEPNITQASVRYDLRNIGLNVSAFYLLSAQPISGSLGIGLKYELGILKNGTTEQLHEKNSQFLSAQILYRAEYRIHDRMYVFIQPSFSAPLFESDNNNMPFRIRQQRAGVGIGITYLTP